MKKIIVSLIVFGMIFAAVGGQTIPENEAAMIDELINSTITINKVPIESEALAQVFNGTFYKVTPTYNHNGGVASCEEYYMVIYNGKVTELENTGETRTLDILFSLLKKGIKIQDESEAKIFESALDAIYPVDWSVNADDKKYLQRDGKWLFLRGDFFGSKKGFVITLGQNSEISQIDYDLEAIKTE